MYSRQIPLTGGRHVRSVSRPALPCPGAGPALAASCLVLGRLVGLPTSLIVDRALPIYLPYLTVRPAVTVVFVSLFIAV